jgi:restriction system protein
MKYKQMKYLRLRMGRQGQFFQKSFDENFIGVSYDLDFDISKDLTDNWRDFNSKYVDVLTKKNPEKSRVGAGLNCGVIWTLSKGIKQGAVILCPDLDGNFHPCKVISDYCYEKADDPYHRRKVEWFKNPILKEDMSKILISSMTAQNTLIDISKHANEIESLLNEDLNKLSSNDPTVEDPSEFALEKHLEDFLIKNWKSTSLGKKYDVYEEDGELVGQQYPSDTGPIDILAISKDKKTLLVVELKKGRVSDNVVGQIQRYMGFVKSELAEKNQDVKGVIIGHDDDVRIHRALSVANNIEFYKYKVNFKLFK